jgi:hypothetical protein
MTIAHSMSVPFAVVWKTRITSAAERFKKRQRVKKQYGFSNRTQD